MTTLQPALKGVKPRINSSKNKKANSNVRVQNKNISCATSPEMGRVLNKAFLGGTCLDETFFGKSGQKLAQHWRRRREFRLNLA
ncbi:MAG: hypothetical protein AAGC91_00830 [Pseudomonadota bacterium]